MKQIHRLLGRQKRRCFGDSFSIPDDLHGFFDAVNSAYWESDTDRDMLERALELSSQELLEANSEIRKSEERFRLLYESSPVPYQLLDSEGCFIEVNQTFLDTLGYLRHEIIGRSFSDVMTQESATLFQQRFQRFKESGTVRDVGYELIHKDSTRISIMLDGRISSNQDGSFKQIHCVWRDITEHKKMEDELRKYRVHLEDMVKERTAELRLANKQLQREMNERKQAEKLLLDSEKRYRNLVENINDIIFTMNTQGYFTYISSVVEKISLYKVDELIGKPFACFAHPDDLPGLLSRLETTLAGQPEPYEFRVLDKDGTVRHVRTSSSPYYEGDKLAGLTGVLVDMTERKHFEQEMARLDRMNLVGEMAAGIGHEIRNPMTTVRGFLQLLSGKKDCAKHKEYFDLMIEELDRANSIITEFLSLAKNRVVELKNQNLNRIVRSISPLIEADGMVTDKHIAFELREIPGIPLDEKEIRQLIFNLARNGLEAMPPGGILSIRTFREDNQVVLAVQDLGKGIEPSVLEKIGTPFFTTKDNGTGLGLAVCYSIAASHNAKIDVETGVTGTTFYVRFKAGASC